MYKRQSVDRLLQKNFGERWISFDGDSAGNVINTDELETIISKNSNAVAFSSHQIIPPLPLVSGNVFPVVFLRDPVDRIKSAYLFEWQKQLGLKEPKGSFIEYVTAKFKNKRCSSVEEFQTIRLSNTRKNGFRDVNADDQIILEQACEFISSLSFVGIVDQFDISADNLSLIHI